MEYGFRHQQKHKKIRFQLPGKSQLARDIREETALFYSVSDKNETMFDIPKH